jgi:hypothetical protein
MPAEAIADQFPARPLLARRMQQPWKPLQRRREPRPFASTTCRLAAVNVTSVASGSVFSAKVFMRMIAQAWSKA